MNPYEVHSNTFKAEMVSRGDSLPMVNWNGKDRGVIPMSAKRLSQLSAGGFQLNADFQFECSASDFNDTNISIKSLKDMLLETPLTYLGDQYKIIEVLIKPGAFQLEVFANSLNQNA